MVLNKKILNLLFLLIIAIDLPAQKDTLKLSQNPAQKSLLRESVNINIYPVPVKNNIFTIKCDREISAVKVTNMIGQDIHRVEYKNPLNLSKIILNNPQRGMYLVTISFRDGTRIVRKIMIEPAE